MCVRTYCVPSRVRGTHEVTQSVRNARQNPRRQYPRDSSAIAANARHASCERSHRPDARFGALLAVPTRGARDFWRWVMGILGWILFGLVVGALAKLVMPGRDPGGIIVTMLLGIAGAVIGGFIGRAMGFYGPGQTAGWLMSFAGAVLLLFIYRLFVGRRTVP